VSNEHNGVIVVKLGGASLDGGVDPVLDAIASLASTRPVVLVHGGGKSVDDLLGRLGVTSRRIDGLRVTTEEEIDIVAGVLGGTVNKRLVGGLIRRGSRAVGLCLSDGGELLTERLMHPAGDLGRVGRIGGTGTRFELLALLLERGYVPVLSSIGMDARGELYNVNADDAASALAGVLGASALLLLTDVEGIRGSDGGVIGSIDRTGIELLIEQGVITGGMIPKALGAVAAADRSGSDVIIASWKSGETLRSLGAGSIGGTRVTAGGVRQETEAAR